MSIDNLSGHPSEKQATIDRVNQLTTGAIEVASLHKDDSQRHEKSLALMKNLETAIEELGLRCTTIGEGDDRAIVFTEPIERHTIHPLDITGISHWYGMKQPMDMGKVQTTYEEHLFVNRDGLGKLIIPVDQEGEIDPTSPLFTKPNIYSDKLERFVGEAQAWAKSMRNLTQWNGRQNKRALEEIIKASSYPPPPPNLNLNSDEYTWNDYHFRNTMYQTGLILFPGSAFSPISPIYAWQWDRRTDINTDDLPIGGFNSTVLSVRVIKPEFITQAVKTSVRPQSLKAA